MNLCRACNEDFSTVRAFDGHRVGRHEYRFDADHLDGRRCLDTEELTELGWKKSAKGRWQDTTTIRRASETLPVSLRAPAGVRVGSFEGDSP